MKKALLAGGLAAMAFAFAVPVSAAVVFSDDFNRSNSDTVGNSWVEIDKDAGDAAIASNALLLRDLVSGGAGTSTNPDTAATRTVSTLGYNNITAQFSWAALLASDNSDFLYAAWKLSSDATWTPLFSNHLGNNSGNFFTTAVLGALASDTSIDFRFWTNVNASEDGARIDWLTISGDQIVTTQVANAIPEPTSLALLGLGLLGMGATLRRKTAA